MRPERRPDLSTLSGESVERVRAVLRKRDWRCPACGGAGADVGRALYLGFLFASEDQDAYMIGLVCRNHRCPRPRSGVRLAVHEFVAYGQADPLPTAEAEAAGSAANLADGSSR